MGVVTTADNIKDSLAEETFKIIQQIRTLKTSFEAMVDPETWGGDEWASYFVNQVEEDIESLDTISRKLGKIKRHY